MRKVLIVATTVVVFVVGLGTGAYLWVHATFVLPGASCGTVGSFGLDDQTRLATGASGAPQCFLTAARTCAAAGIRVHSQAGESATSYVFIINAGGAPGRCQVTEYSRDEFYLGTGPVQVTGCREASVTSKGVLLFCPNLSGPALIPPTVTSQLDPLQVQVGLVTACGRVFAQGLGPGTQIVTESHLDLSADQAALRCFAAAARACAQARILIIPYPALGMGTVFTIEQGERPPACQVARQFPRPPGTPGAVAGFDICREVSITSKGVLLACARQAILIPATVAKILPP
jgi:hypothetical protein